MALVQAPTQNARLLAWVDELVELCQPDDVHWFDGSDAEHELLCKQLVDAGTFVELDAAKRPGSYWAHSDPSDVARVEDRTFICSANEADAGPTNNWKAPAEMRATLAACFLALNLAGCIVLVPLAGGDAIAGPGVLAALLALVVAGHLVGARAFKRLDPERFSLAVLALVVLTGLASVVAGATSV